MFFSRITIDARSAEPRELLRLAKGDVYAIHQILWRLFPEAPDAERDFLFRQEFDHGWPFFYMVSKRQPQGINGSVQVETKIYQPRLRNGQRLAFSLRANPVITKKTRDGKRRVRHDVVMNTKHDIANASSEMIELSAGEIQHTAGSKWLYDKASRHGFSFDPDLVRVFGYQQHHIKSSKQKNKIQFSTLDYNGLLTIANAKLFHQTLTNGIGRAKAFGCGLMLVRRA
jgi:CRISPR system Cascade subunit CasE